MNRVLGMKVDGYSRVSLIEYTSASAEYRSGAEKQKTLRSPRSPERVLGIRS